MKKKLLLTTSLCLLAGLSSCGSSPIEGTLFMQNGDVTLSYKIDDTLKSGSKINGSLNIKETASLKDSYILSYTYEQPKMSTISHSETGLYTFLKANTEGKTKVDFEVELNLEKVFPKDKEVSNIYFVVRSFDFSFTDLGTYSYASFSYAWDGDNVKLTNI